MKRRFNVFDGLFLLALYFKLSHTGPSISWFEAFAPYMVESVSIIVGAVAKTLSLKDRYKFLVWKIAMRLRVRQAAKQSAQFMKMAEEAKATTRKESGNPGAFVDPANKGGQ